MATNLKHKLFPYTTGMTVLFSWKRRDLKADELLIIQLSLHVEEILKLLHGPELEYDWYDLLNPR